MNDSQKRATKREFFSVSVSEPQRREDQTPKEELSVSSSKSGIISIPFPVLDAMFKKAAAYVQEGTMTWKVPNDEHNSYISTFLVHSKSSSNPHKVILTKKTNRVQCDKACINWSTYSLCSHCLTVAEISGVLKPFIQWFKNRKKSANLTALVNVNMPKNAGEKKGSKKRKGKANQMPSTGKNVMAQRLPTPSDASTSTQVLPFQLQEVQPAQPGMHQVQPTAQSPLHPMQNVQCTTVTQSRLQVQKATNAMQHPLLNMFQIQQPTQSLQLCQPTQSLQLCQPSTPQVQTTTQSLQPHTHPKSKPPPSHCNLTHPKSKPPSSHCNLTHPTSKPPPSHCTFPNLSTLKSNPQYSHCNLLNLISFKSNQPLSHCDIPKLIHSKSNPPPRHYNLPNLICNNYIPTQELLLLGQLNCLHVPNLLLVFFHLHVYHSLTREFPNVMDVVKL